MKLWVRVVRSTLWIVGGAIGLLLLLIVGFIAYDHWQFQHALRVARGISPNRLEHLIAEARRLEPVGRADTEYLSTSSTPFSDLGPKYVIVMPGRVDLVFYKMFEDEVCIQVHHSIPRVELVHLDRDKWLVEELWPKEMKQNQAPLPTRTSVTPSADARVAPAALVVGL